MRKNICDLNVVKNSIHNLASFKNIFLILYKPAYETTVPHTLCHF